MAQLTNFANKVINFFGKNPPTVNEDVAKIVEWETKIGEITEHEYSSRDRYEYKSSDRQCHRIFTKNRSL